MAYPKTAGEREFDSSLSGQQDEMLTVGSLVGLVVGIVLMLSSRQERGTLFWLGSGLTIVSLPYALFRFSGLVLSSGSTRVLDQPPED